MTKLMGTCTLKRIKELWAAIKNRKEAATMNGNDNIGICSNIPGGPEEIATKAKEGDERQRFKKKITDIGSGLRRAAVGLKLHIPHRRNNIADGDGNRACNAEGSKKKLPKAGVWAASTAGIMAVAALSVMLIADGTDCTERQTKALSTNMAQGLKAVSASKFVREVDIDEQTLSAEPEDSTPRVFAETGALMTQTQDVYAATTTTIPEEESAAMAALGLSVAVDTVDLQIVPLIEETEAENAPLPAETVALDVTTELVTDELVAFYVTDADEYYDEVGYSTNHYDYTDSDLYLLAQLIDIESRGEPFEGMVAVGNVVMNRVLNTEQFGHTISKVVKSGQFAYSRHSKRRPSKAAMAAAEAVLEDEYWVVAQDVYFFRSGVKSNKNWKTREFYTRIKGHCFYTYNYGGRCQDLGIPPKLYERVFKYAQYGCEPGERVRRIQLMLREMGYRVPVDSYFGEETQEALVLFQQENGLSTDGVAGPATVKALIKTYGFDRYHDEFLAEQP